MTEPSQTFDGTFAIPCAFLLLGAPGSGKSEFIRGFLCERKALLREPIDNIVIFYGERSQLIKDLEEAKGRGENSYSLFEGLPENIFEYIKEDARNFFIFDDLQELVSNSEQILDLVTKKFQHKCVSWMMTFQNAFHQKAVHRVSITRAATHIVLFNSPLDKSVPYILASRVMPESRKTFLEIFKDATKEPFSYLVCDGGQSTPNQIRLRSNIFEGKQVIYSPLPRV